jgi:hypothetical protein
MEQVTKNHVARRRRDCGLMAAGSSQLYFLQSRIEEQDCQQSPPNSRPSLPSPPGPVVPGTVGVGVSVRDYFGGADQSTTLNLKIVLITVRWKQDPAVAV